MTPALSGLLAVTFPMVDLPMSDLETRTSYLTKREVDLLPIRRVLTSKGRLRDSVILLNDLSPADSSLLLRVKHVALDFTNDFRGNPGVVPGKRFVGKIPSQHEIVADKTTFSPKDRLLVFPYSTCWIQDLDFPCQNCNNARNSNLDEYENHRQRPCTRQLTYGTSLNGGLQEYIRVPKPAYSLLKIPEQVSLHDGCFLFDIALPFLSYCVDNLVSRTSKNSQFRVIIYLDDIRKEANDCLLVIKHLRLDHTLFTFTDSRTLNENPTLINQYENRFHHVIVFAPDKDALELAARFVTKSLLQSVRTDLQSYLVVFDDRQEKRIVHDDFRTLLVKLSYKDKSLLENLLGALAVLNARDPIVSLPTPGERGIKRMGTLDSNCTILGSESSHNSELEVSSAHSKSSSNLSCLDETKEHGDDGQMRPGEKFSSNLAMQHISWLHCDKDFRLCSDDNCFHTMSSQCQQTRHLNEMLASKCQLKRAFFTNRSACHVKLNAFIL